MVCASEGERINVMVTLPWDTIAALAFLVLLCAGFAMVSRGEGLAAPSPFSVHRSGGNCVYVLGSDIEVVPVGVGGC